MLKKPRYRLKISVVNNGLLVFIAAEHKTKDTLRQAFILAKAFTLDGQLESVEAWDNEKDEQIASFKKPTNQPTTKTLNNKTTRRKKNVVQSDNNRRQPGKRS